jgi:type IV secretion system protein VirB10
MFLRVTVSTAMLAGMLLYAEEPAAPAGYPVPLGTKVPLSLINSVSTKHSSEGDRIYLETVFPIMAKGRIVIPPGSYVAGTVTQVKRPGRVKGRGELYVRFDSLTLPNGVTRDFRARLGSTDGRGGEELDKAEGKIKSEGNKAGDARSIGEATAAGASVGVIAGGATGHYGMGTGIGAAAGAAAGLIGVLASRGPDAVLAKGSTIEMVLDRTLTFQENELISAPIQPARYSEGPGPEPAKKSDGTGILFPRRRP